MLLGYVTCGIASSSVANLAYLAAPWWLFVPPLIYLVPMNTGYLSKPELVLCCFFTVTYALSMAIIVEKEQRNGFEVQVAQPAVLPLRL